MMNRNQILVIGLALALILGLYFAPIKPSGQSDVERSRAIEMESTDKTALLRKAGEKYTADQLSEAQRLSELIESYESDSLKLDGLEKLSGAWYKIGEPALAGVYAEEIATNRKDEASWSIAGTTYALGMKTYTEQGVRKFCQGRAVKALENAISINPDNSQHRVNLALCYVDMPLEDQPMKGILMLRDLLERNPKDVTVLTQLGTLAIRTGQYEKAVERLGTAFTVEPNNKQVLSLLVSAYQGMGDIPNTEKYKALLYK